METQLTKRRKQVKPLRRTAGLGVAQALALMLVLGGLAHADVELGADEFDSKAIRVDAPEKEPLRVALEPVKESFKVDEPIRFKIRGNKTFYLYLFSVDDESGDAILILPTREGQRHNKYPANRTLPVPNPDEPDFLSDQAGREKLVMVASTKYLPVKSNWFRDGADSYVGKAEDLEKEFADKGIRIGRDRTRDANVLVKRMSVRIRGRGGRDEDDETATAGVWLTTKGDRSEYVMGERIEAVFGAEEDGWLQMYVVTPNGKHQRLKSFEVEGGEAYTMKAVAEDPAGRHALVAVYTEDEPEGELLGRNRSKGVSLLDAAPKGVRLVDDEPVPMAVYRFRIEED